MLSFFIFPSDFVPYAVACWHMLRVSATLENLDDLVVASSGHHNCMEKGLLEEEALLSFNILLDSFFTPLL